MNTELPVVSELIPIEQYNLALEEEFIQAGQVLLEIGRKAFLGLGELVAWKMARECAEDEASRSALIARYANAWGVSRALRGSWRTPRPVPPIGDRGIRSRAA